MYSEVRNILQMDIFRILRISICACSIKVNSFEIDYLIHTAIKPIISTEMKDRLLGLRYHNRYLYSYNCCSRSIINIYKMYCS